MSLQHQYSQQGSEHLLSLEGMIDENSDFSKIPTPTAGTLTIDLEKISMLNSMGLRNWVQWARQLHHLSVITLRNCPAIVVNQINILDGFLPPNAIVESVEVPYYCESCGYEDNYLAHRGKDYHEATADQNQQINVPETIPCPDCGKTMEGDFLPDKHFFFLKKRRA